MDELDESFQLTVKRAVAPFKDESAPEKPSADVSSIRRVAADV